MAHVTETEAVRDASSVETSVDGAADVKVEHGSNNNNNNNNNNNDNSSNTRWWSDEEDRRVRRKLDWHIVPFLFTSYLLAFLDRSNIGNAKVAGMNEALKLSDSQYQWLLTIFYISYIIFQFLLIGYKFIRPSLFMGTCVTLWGVAAILQATAFNWSGLMAARFFIGLSEAGYGTGVALYLSFWYPRTEIGLRFAGFVVGSAVASAIAGSVAYGIQGADVGIAHWRLIFIVEAAPTIVLGVLIYLLLPDSIATARFLTPHERRIAEARLYRATIDQTSISNGDSSEDAEKQKVAMPSEKRMHKLRGAVQDHFNVRNGLEALRDPISYISAALLFIINVGFASIPVYLPTILSQMGYTSLRAQAFSAPPYAAAFPLAVLLSFLADRWQVRGMLMSIMTAIGLVGYFILATVEDNHTRYGGVWLVVIGLFTFIPLCYMWLIANSSGESKRGIGLVMFGTVGQCGPVLGTNIFPATDAPYYKRGMYVSAGLLVAAFVIELSTIVYFHTLNRRKDAQLAQLQQEPQQQQQTASRPMQYARTFDQRTPEGRQELHLRRLDMAENRERSVYFRYSL